MENIIQNSIKDKSDLDTMLKLSCNRHRATKTLGSFLILLSLSACANMERPVLSLSAKQAMKSGQLTYQTVHPDLEVDIEGSNSAQVMGGLLFLAADMAMMAKQESDQADLMAPIKEEIKDIHLLDSLRAEIEPVIHNSNAFQLAKGAGDKTATNYDATGALTPRYKFSEDFASLNTNLHLTISAESEQFKTALGVSPSFDKPIINTNLTHSYSPVGAQHALPRSAILKETAKKNLSQKLTFAGPVEAQKLIEKEIARIRAESKQNNIALWTKDHGKELKQALSEARQVIPQKLQTALSAMFPNAAHAKK